MKIHADSRHLSLLHDILKKYDYGFFAFGSRTTGKHKALSDLDLFYFEDIPNNKILKLEEEFEESDIPFKIDLINYHKCDVDFQNLISQHYLCFQSSSKLKTIEENHRGHFAFLPKILGFDGSEMHDVTVINCGLQSSMFNIAYGAPKQIDSIQKIKDAFAGQSFAWWIPPSQHDPALTKALIDKGFSIETVEHAMICDLPDVSVHKQKTELSITPVTTQKLLEDFISVVEIYDPAVRAFYQKMNEKSLGLQEKLFVGHVRDNPISIGILFIQEENAGIFSLITNETERGKGYGADMMAFLMNTAKEKRCRSVTLSASSDSGYRLYKRLGFQKIGEFECFEYKGD